MSLWPRVARALLVVLLVLGLVAAPAVPALASRVSSEAAPDATSWNTQRKMGRDSEGRLHVALRIHDVDLGVAVRVFRSDPAVTGWSALPRVPDATSEMSRASLAIDPEDAVHLAWTEQAGPDLQIFHAVWADEAWSPRTQVSATPGYSGYPSIAVDGQDRLHVVWYGFDGSTYQVYYRARASNGTWERTETVSTGLQDANNPALALGPDDRPHVAWALFSGGQSFVVYTSREAVWVPITTLSDAANRAFDPTLAVASDGEVFAAWTEQAPDGSRNLIARRHDASGWLPPNSLAGFPSPGGHPTLALDGAYNGTWGPMRSLAANGTAIFPSARWAAVANPLFEGVNRIDVAWTEEVDGTHAVVVAGLPVAAVGEPPSPSFNAPVSLPILAVVLAVVGVGVVILWWIRRSPAKP